MHTLRRNQKYITYQLYTGMTEAVDADGNYTGELTKTYSDPVTVRMFVSASRGTADVEQFGINLNYSKTLITDDMECPIAEDSIVVFDGINYSVVAIAKSLNHITYAIKETNIS